MRLRRYDTPSGVLIISNLKSTPKGGKNPVRTLSRLSGPASAGNSPSHYNQVTR
jgi:hypothetical protein